MKYNKELFEEYKSGLQKEALDIKYSEFNGNLIRNSEFVSIDYRDDEQVSALKGDGLVGWISEKPVIWEKSF